MKTQREIVEEVIVNMGFGRAFTRVGVDFDLNTIHISLLTDKFYSIYMYKIIAKKIAEIFKAAYPIVRIEVFYTNIRIYSFKIEDNIPREKINMEVLNEYNRYSNC